ncbi:hypothetical protein K435DRAFT_774343 [Dendrothele bispora CBS 962.96]|uniref:Uncharacterized protein n=1 Tax=Dendrothele bispora (strain CBS 962.96) TaxID=1314807 RepID=A0A4S8MQK5_DENBC|nr:hypothetical protein K435DRAFT_774343 [Dendrothele bispora CBS 962.96]
MRPAFLCSGTIGRGAGIKRAQLAAAVVYYYEALPNKSCVPLRVLPRSDRHLDIDYVPACFPRTRSFFESYALASNHVLVLLHRPRLPLAALLDADLPSCVTY